MRRVTLVALGFTLLPFFASAGSAQTATPGGAQQDIRYITKQFQGIATDYLPGTAYEKTMNDLLERVQTLTEDESRYLKPLLPGMLANLQVFKEALSSAGRSQTVRYARQTTGGVVFPDAEYPNIQIAAYQDLYLPAFFDVLGLWPTITNFLATGQVTSDKWTSSWVNAAPLTCVTRLDADGNPIRMPDISIQTLRVAVQVAEATKEGANCVLEQVLVAATVGANAKWLTIIPTSIWLVEKAIYENITQCEGMISGAETAAAYQRLGHIHGDLDGIGTSLNSIGSSSQADLSTIKTLLANIGTKLDQAIDLLKTPPGLRPDFPKK